MPKIFIAYSSEDLDFVRKLVNNLEELGFTVLLDKKHFVGGRSTKEEIRNRIQQVDNFIPIMTGDSIRSNWVRPVETEWALKLLKEGKNLRIMPLLLRKMRGYTTFPELAHLNYFDFTGEDQALAFGKLVQALPDVEYDELSYLQKALNEEPVENRTMLKILRRMVARPRKSGRRPDWASMSAEQFMREAKRVVRGEEALDSAYWLLIIYGVLKFKDIEKFWDKEDTYPNSVKYSKVAPRGIALMNDLTMQVVQSRSRRKIGHKGRSVFRIG